MLKLIKWFFLLTLPVFSMEEKEDGEALIISKKTPLIKTEEGRAHFSKKSQFSNPKDLFPSFDQESNLSINGEVDPNALTESTIKIIETKEGFLEKILQHKSPLRDQYESTLEYKFTQCGAVFGRMVGGAFQGVGILAMGGGKLFEGYLGPTYSNFIIAGGAVTWFIGNKLRGFAKHHDPGYEVWDEERKTILMFYRKGYSSVLDQYLVQQQKKNPLPTPDHTV